VVPSLAPNLAGPLCLNISFITISSLSPLLSYLSHLYHLSSLACLAGCICLNAEQGEEESISSSPLSLLNPLGVVLPHVLVRLAASGDSTVVDQLSKGSSYVAHLNAVDAVLVLLVLAR